MAHIITEEYHGKDGADKAQEAFINVVSNKGIPEDIPEYKLVESQNILDLLLELKFIQSKGEGKRLIQGGGVKFEGEKVAEPTFLVEKEGVLQAGKRKFAKVVR